MQSAVHAQVKEEGWWLVLGDTQTNELHAVTRTSFGARTSARLAVEGSAYVCLLWVKVSFAMR